MKQYIVTVTAADQVGIVHTISGTLRARGGNILELSQTVMRGYFTLILEVAFPEPLSTKGLAGALTADGEKYDVTVAVIEADEKKRNVPVPDGERFILTVLGDDAIGNVQGISGRPGRARGEHRRPACEGRRRSLLPGDGGVPTAASVAGLGACRPGAIRPPAWARSIRPARKHLPGDQRAQSRADRTSQDSRRRRCTALRTSSSRWG